jgi:hypothetical protein
MPGKRSDGLLRFARNDGELRFEKPITSFYVAATIRFVVTTNIVWLIFRMDSG